MRAGLYDRAEKLLLNWPRAAIRRRAGVPGTCPRTAARLDASGDGALSPAGHRRAATAGGDRPLSLRAGRGRHRGARSRRRARTPAARAPGAARLRPQRDPARRPRAHAGRPAARAAALPARGATRLPPAGTGAAASGGCGEAGGRCACFRRSPGRASPERARQPLGDRLRRHRQRLLRRPRDPRLRARVASADNDLKDITSALLPGSTEPSDEQLRAVANAMRNVVLRHARYRCSECGLDSSSFLWQCPGCQSWRRCAALRRWSSCRARRGRGRAGRGQGRGQGMSAEVVRG